MISSLPSPTQSVWHLSVWHVGSVPIRAYALCIIAGIVLAVWLGERRWRARGGEPGLVLDIAGWAVPFGVIGGRIYHVATSWEPYFGPGGDPVQALFVWNGGLGIWGAVAFGALGVWIACRRRGILLPPMADALAPGIVFAQAMGRWGNWFNNELHGSHTSLPWGLQIYEWDQGAGAAVRDASGHPVLLGTFHPTFLYESLWCIGVGAVIIWADRRFTLGHGRVFALYVLLYAIGRGWIEALRVDDAHHLLGLRLNDWTAMVVSLGALIALVISQRRHPGRETSVVRGGGPEPVDGEPVDGEPVDGEHHDEEPAEPEGDASAAECPTSEDAPEMPASAPTSP